MIICIDGPAAAGKGVIARNLAKTLSFSYLNSGELYRAIGYMITKNHVDFFDINTIASYCDGLSFDLVLSYSNEGVLESSSVAYAASIVASIPLVREKLLNLQRNLAKNNDLVADGRDMGTIVFPKAEYKFFLSANIKTRARRRYLQLKEKENIITYDYTLKELLARDERDKIRTAPAINSMMLDNTYKSIEQTLSVILNIVKSSK